MRVRTSIEEKHPQQPAKECVRIVHFSLVKQLIAMLPCELSDKLIACHTVALLVMTKSIYKYCIKLIV